MLMDSNTNITWPYNNSGLLIYLKRKVDSKYLILNASSEDVAGLWVAEFRNYSSFSLDVSKRRSSGLY